VEELNKLNQLLRERESNRWCNSAIVRSTRGYNRKLQELARRQITA